MSSADDENTTKKNALEICQDFLSGSWRNVKIEDFRITKVSGGYSNKLYKCYVDETALTDDLNPKEVLLRINGPIKKDFETLIQEAVINAILVERGLAPKLYGVFDQGRLEEFIPSVTPKAEQMPDLSIWIAKEIAKIHCLHIPTRKKASKLLDLTEEWLKYLENNTNLDGDEPTPNWKQMVCSRKLRRELDWLKELAKESGSPVVFCHNDLHSGNILLRVDDSVKSVDKKNFVIDFEYSCYNYRGYEIAGVFVNMCLNMEKKEYPFYEIYWEKFPDEKTQELFIEAYFEQMSKEILLPENFRLEEEKQQILKEVQIFRMMYILIAAVWSLQMSVSTKKGEFDLGFIEFGESCLEFCQIFKNEYLDNQKKGKNKETKEKGP